MCAKAGIRKRGFSIPEVIIGTLLLMVIMAVTYQFYSMAKVVWVYIYVQGDLERTAMISMERMIHGVDVDNVAVGAMAYNTPKGLQEARSIIQPAVGATASQLEFEDQDNPGVSRLFFQTADRLVYTDSLNNSRDLIEEGVQALSFTMLAADVVQIDLTLQRNVLGRVMSSNSTTTVQLRNL